MATLEGHDDLNYETPLTPEEMTERLDVMVGQTMEIIKRSLQREDEESANVFWRSIHHMALLGRAYVSADPTLREAPPAKPGQPPVWQPVLEAKALAYSQIQPDDNKLADIATYFSSERDAALQSLDAGVSWLTWQVTPEELLEAISSGVLSVLEPEDIPPDLQLGFVNAQS